MPIGETSLEDNPIHRAEIQVRVQGNGWAIAIRWAPLYCPRCLSRTTSIDRQVRCAPTRCANDGDMILACVSVNIPPQTINQNVRAHRQHLCEPADESATEFQQSTLGTRMRARFHAREFWQTQLGQPTLDPYPYHAKEGHNAFIYFGSMTTWIDKGIFLDLGVGFPGIGLLCSRVVLTCSP